MVVIAVMTHSHSPLYQNKQSPLVVLQQRTWLIHWSLYVYFNHEKGPEDIINFFLYEQQ
jgi:translation initiation factor 3 subunit E